MTRLEELETEYARTQADYRRLDKHCFGHSRGKDALITRLREIANECRAIRETHAA